VPTHEGSPVRGIACWIAKSCNPLALGLYDWNSKTQYAGAPPFLYAAVITGALVAVVPLIVAFALLQRYWAGGLAVGAVKG
jgi:multiple sugar transport system permease protein